MDDTIKSRLETMMSDKDLSYYLGPECRVITYSELQDYHNILDLLPLQQDFVILLIESQPNVGHWTAIFRNGKTIAYFDPYGVKPDGQITKNDKETRNELGQKPDELTRLLSTSPIGFKLIYNKCRLQQNDTSNNILINTCGRHCISVLLCSLMLNWSLSKYQKTMKMLAKKLGLTTDELVCRYIE